MSDLDGQNLRQFRARGAGITRMSDAGMSGTGGSLPSSRPIRRLAAPITQPFPVATTAPEETMSEDHVDDLIAGYALDALEPDERLAVERHAAFCPACARQLAQLRRTATMLPFAVAPAAPSPDVKAALFARIAHSTAPVSTEQADDFSWARPVQPKPQATLPASGSWTESLPPITSSSVVPTRRRRSLGRMIGVATPVFLTFGLLALFVIPQMLPSDGQENQDYVDLLNSGAAECTGSDGPLFASAGISACGYVGPNGTLYVNNLVDTTLASAYAVNVPMVDGGYQLVGTLEIDRNAGQLQFDRPEGWTGGPLCITGLNEDPTVSCQAAQTPVT